MDRPRLVLFDGNALVHRAYHAMKQGRPLTTRDGEVVSGVYVFTSMLLKILRDLKPTHYALAFDPPGPTFRHEMFPQYKAHRPPTPEELVHQMERVRQLAHAFRMPAFELQGYEADDVIGTLSRQAEERGVETIVATGDADTMQLVTPLVKVLYPRPRGAFADSDIFGEAQVEERYGISPEHVPDLKALEGDPSDNIPGVPGIGRKTAARLIQQFGGIDGIYARIDEVTPPGIQKRLREGEEAARQSRKLATIVTGAPVRLDLEACRTSHYDRAMVTDLMRELEFSSLMDKLPENGPPSGESAVGAGPAVAQDYRMVTTAEGLDGLMSRLSGIDSVAFDLETTGLNAIRDLPVGISISPAPGEAYYVPVGHVGWGVFEHLSLERVLARMKPFFEDTCVAKVAHNGKFDVTVLAQQGVSVSNLASDTMIAAHLLSEKALGLKALAFQRLGVEMTPITDLIGTGTRQLSMSQVDANLACEYACADADMTGRLNDVLVPELHREGLWQLYSEVEMPLVPVLVHMERSGIRLDTGLLERMARRLGEQLGTIEQEIYRSIGHQFNINSPRQLGSVLFEELQLPPSRRKKTGYSTDAAVLEGLRGTHPVVDLLLAYRQLFKVKSTYTDPLGALVNPGTGRVHTRFNQTQTATGRLSSSDPNLQNIPIRGELGGEVRQAFTAPAGCRLLGADYSQIDLRSLAHLSGDEALIAAFRHDEDIHSATAARLYDVPPEEVTPEMRRLAKTVNFGVIYGMSEFGLQQATELSREDAAAFIEAYFARYPDVRRYLESTKQQARSLGYVKTLLHRKRVIAEINSSNRQVREAAERMAINMPVQGTSADIIKVAMVNLYREMQRRGLRSRMVLQVHDDLMFEVPQDEVAEMQEMVPRLMSTALELSVPLRVEAKVGSTWGEME